MGGKPLTVMTRNLYVGADFSPIVLALYQGNVAQVPGLVSAAYSQIVASDFPARAKAIAAEIATYHADLVGLQEVSLIRTQFPGFLLTGQFTPAVDVAYDYLDILLSELNQLGLRYTAVATATNLDVELPSQTGMDVRLTDRDVILVRGDLPPGHLRLSNVQSGNFSVNLQIPLNGSVLTVSRGWCAVDVFTRGRTLRFITAHLDDGPALVRAAQAAELLSGPAAVPLPVILAGDFNTDANGTDDAYSILTAAGLNDAWDVAFPGQTGNTCCQAADLLNPQSLLQTRIDLILYRGSNLALEGVELLGENPSDRILSLLFPGLATLLWPSDHAGIAATLEIH